MGAYKYVEELYKKKQSDVIRYLLRVRTWRYRQATVCVRVPHPTRPEKAHRLGFKAKQGFVIYRIRVRRGGRKRQVRKGKTMDKPKNQGVTGLKPKRSLQATAEERVGRRCGELRILNSYWVGQDATYKFFEVICVDPFHKAVRRDAKVNWICRPQHKHREMRGLTSAGRKSRGIGKGSGYNHNLPSQRAAWKRKNTLSLKRYR